MMIGGVRGAAGKDNDVKDAFNQPTDITFAPNGDMFVSDGYVNSRVIKFNKDGDYLKHWGRKGTGDGEFNLVHDVAWTRAAGCMSRTVTINASRSSTRTASFSLNGRIWSPLGSRTPSSARTQFICATA